MSQNHLFWSLVIIFHKIDYGQIVYGMKDQW